MVQVQKVQLDRKGFWAIGLTLFMIAYGVSGISAVMPKIVFFIRPITLETAISGMQTSLLLTLVCTVICFALTTALPRYSSCSLE